MILLVYINCLLTVHQLSINYPLVNRPSTVHQLDDKYASRSLEQRSMLGLPNNCILQVNVHIVQLYIK